MPFDSTTWALKFMWIALDASNCAGVIAADTLQACSLAHFQTGKLMEKGAHLIVELRKKPGALCNEEI